MKARTRHLTSITPFGSRFFPDAPERYEWFCDCGETESGYATQEAAAEAATFHEEHAPVMPPNTGAYRPVPVPKT